METLLPAESDWCNFRKRRTARACKTSDCIGERRRGFVRDLGGRRSPASSLPYTRCPALGTFEDRGCRSKVSAGMASPKIDRVSDVPWPNRNRQWLALSLI